MRKLIFLATMKFFVKFGFCDELNMTTLETTFTAYTLRRKW